MDPGLELLLGGATMPATMGNSIWATGILGVDPPCILCDFLALFLMCGSLSLVGTVFLADPFLGQPRSRRYTSKFNRSRGIAEEIPLIESDQEAMLAIQTLRERRGYSPEAVRSAMELQPVPTTRVRERQAARASLDMRVRTEVGRILAARGVNPQGLDLDRARLGRTNFVVLKAALDRLINQAVGRGTHRGLQRDERAAVE